MDRWGYDMERKKNEMCIRKMVQQEERRGKRVRIGYKKIKMEDEWWYWDDKEEVFKNRNNTMGDNESRGGERAKNEKENGKWQERR